MTSKELLAKGLKGLNEKSMNRVYNEKAIIKTTIKKSNNKK